MRAARLKRAQASLKCVAFWQKAHKSELLLPLQPLGADHPITTTVLARMASVRPYPAPASGGPKSTTMDKVALLPPILMDVPL